MACSIRVKKRSRTSRQQQR